MRYTVDPKASKFTARAFAGGMLSGLGHSPTFAVRAFSGEVEFDPAAGTAALRLSISSESLELVDDLSARDRWDIMHIMQEELLEVSAYPTITYDCPASGATVRAGGGGGYEVQLNGQLTLHGITRNQPVTARVMPLGDSLRASGEFTLRQPDFSLKHVSVAGSMMKVKDEVKLSFDIVARK